MTVRELKDQIRHLKSLNQFLTRKFEQQSKLLEELSALRADVEVLQAENRHLKKEEELLRQELAAYRSRQINSTIHRLLYQHQTELVEIQKNLRDTLNEWLGYARMTTEQKSHSELAQAGMIKSPHYGNILRNDYITSLEQQVEELKSKLENVTYQYDAQEHLKDYTAKRRGAPQKISAEKIRTIRELREGGMRIRDIAATVDISVGSVHRYLE